MNEIAKTGKMIIINYQLVAQVHNSCLYVSILLTTLMGNRLTNCTQQGLCTITRSYLFEIIILLISPSVETMNKLQGGKSARFLVPLRQINNIII